VDTTSPASTPTRELILNAAANEFRQYGFSGARLARIVEQTGLTKGAMYHLFESKEALAQALIQGKYDHWPSIIRDIDARGLRGVPAAKAIIENVVIAMRDDVRILAGMRLSQELHLVTADNDPYARWASVIESYLALGVEDGTVRSSLDLLQTAHVIVSCSFGIQFVAHETGTASQVRRQLDAMWDILTPGLTPQPS
jgi:AcrR family transcriptional regulator